MGLGAYVPGLGAPGKEDSPTTQPALSTQQIAQRVRNAKRTPGGGPVPVDVDKRARRGRKWMMRDAPKRRLCIRFERGETYWGLNEKNMLVQQNTTTFSNGGGKPPYRIRNSYNFIRPLVESKVASSTQRIPSYDVTATTTDPEDIGAANVARKISIYGYDKWRLKEASRRAVKSAVVTGDGFAWPYFDPNVGPFVDLPDGTVVGTGEIKVTILNGNQVYWEPGTAFENSGWFAVEQVLPLEEVRYLPGFIDSIELFPDGSTAESYKAGPGDAENLVVLTRYFERPCMAHPEGRYLVIANQKVVCPEDKYPLQDRYGNVIDEPLLHRLKYVTDPDSDRDLGLVWQLVDFQRTVQDCYNKMLEWKNRTLNPQMLSPEGSMQERRNDIPGYNYTYKPVGNLKPEWEPPQTQFVQPLQAILEQAKRDMQYVAADLDLAGVVAPNVASSTVQGAVDQAQNRWGAFLGDLADWHSRVMRHCLLLVAKHYDEPRIIQIRGQRGVDNIQNFLGSSLLDQVNVTVSPGSLETRTRQQITQDVFAYFDRQIIGPRQAMMAIETRNLDYLTYSAELDLERINTIIQRIRDGSVMTMAPRPGTDPMTGDPITIPGWMPGESDDVAVWKQTLSDWMKTDEFDRLEPAYKENANLMYSAIVRQEIAKATMQAQLQMATAQNIGMTNAAKPQSTGVVSTPGSSGTPPPQ